MPGDPLKKVQPGQRLQIPAEAFNAFLDASRYVRARQHNNESEAGDEFRQSGIFKVRNATGQDQPRFAVLALREPVIGPDANLREFKNRVNFTGVAPAEPARCEPFAILLEPLADGAIGRGVVAGVTPVRVQVVRETDPFAEPVAGETGHLRSSPFGGTRVLWKESGLGLKWAVVRLGDRPRFAVFELSGQWAVGTPPDPDGWAKMEGCRPVLYSGDSGTYAADPGEPTETVWHAVGYPAGERAALRQLHQETGQFPAKFACGDWAWCHWNDHECRWQVLGGYEDHWRFELQGPLATGGSAPAKLILYQGGSWQTVELTFTVWDALQAVPAELPAGTRGVAKHYADSCRWEVCCFEPDLEPDDSVTLTESKDLQLVLDHCVLRLRWRETFFTFRRNQAGHLVGLSVSGPYQRESSVDLCDCDCDYYGGGGS